jgi:hypothetical protein
MSQESRETKVYDVRLRVRNTFTAEVRATSKAEAIRKARAGEYDEGWPGEPEVTGVISVTEQAS